MNKIYKPSILRILTNSTINCLLIVFMLLIGLEFFFPFPEQYLFIMAIMLEVGTLISIILFTFMERKYSFLELTRDGIKHGIMSSRKRTVFIPYCTIKNIKIESYALKIYYDDNKKLVIDYYKEYKELKKLIDAKICK